MCIARPVDPLRFAEFAPPVTCGSNSLSHRSGNPSQKGGILRVMCTEFVPDVAQLRIREVLGTFGEQVPVEPRTSTKSPL